MFIYTFDDDQMPHGQQAHPSFKKARSARAKRFKKPDRPEIMQIELPNKLTLSVACALLSGVGYAINVKDIA